MSDAEAPRRLRAACCLSLGMGRDSGARSALLDLLADERDDQLAGAAAWGLGLIGRPNSDITKALDRAMRAGRPAVRRRAVRALALLGRPWISGRDGDVVDFLLERLGARPPTGERVDTLVQLARFGDQRALMPLAKILLRPKEPARIRALAAAALGTIGDLELEAALDLLREGTNYRSLTDVLRRAFRLL